MKHVKVFEHFPLNWGNDEPRKMPSTTPMSSSSSRIDAVTFEMGDSKKMAALLKALGSRSVLCNQSTAESYLREGPISVVNSKYIIQHSRNMATALSSDAPLSYEVVCDDLGCSTEDLNSL
jgi:hypothetical protein